MSDILKEIEWARNTIKDRLMFGMDVELGVHCNSCVKDRMDKLQARLDKATDCIKENLEFDKNIFEISDGQGASMYCMLRAQDCLKEIEVEK